MDNGTEVYKCTLSTEIQEIAKKELREDEKMRNHCLEQFRDWISKHPSIKRCRTDAAFLLRFLRTKKFSLPMAQESLERYLTIRQLYPEWYNNLTIDDPILEDIIDSGHIFPLLERDADGKKIIMWRTVCFDPYKYTSVHMVRVQNLMSDALMDDEEDQVLGYTYLYDVSNITMAHFTLWSFVDLRNMINCFLNTHPMRIKWFHIFDLSTIAMKLIEVAMTALSKKQKSKIKMYKSKDEIPRVFDTKILPKEYGGKVPIADMIAAFKQLLRKKQDSINALDDMLIEITSKDKAESDEIFEGISGSFRKLEVD